ncbi:receptor-type adenylate cyclase [Trypanosoma rangeli]|uniref:Receptor-type adenylate cyclase n=1 Tax=Trypanosoma rangeli TaxID=5698 RepID=A0A3R7KJ60_TRYRA|nr:receptor-type adenylate cyclase [Trypanosoma rangeli]RNE95517.1 receptor-type adenylate cyclase [Trypanosoma rangeli]|eukprot:RNE95517.1 receptor-type adenylate cyclase [Trypanosoma rangeli]
MLADGRTAGAYLLAPSAVQDVVFETWRAVVADGGAKFVPTLAFAAAVHGRCLHLRRAAALVCFSRCPWRGRGPLCRGVGALDLLLVDGGDSWALGGAVFGRPERGVIDFPPNSCRCRCVSTSLALRMPLWRLV